MSRETLRLALEEVPGAVVVLSGIGGRPIPEDLLEALTGVTTLIDWNITPWSTIPDEYKTGTFNVYDMSEVSDSGAIIYCEFEKQQKELRRLRDGYLGHDARPSDWVCAAYIDTFCDRIEYYNTAMKAYSRTLKDAGCDDIILWERTNASEGSPALFTVPNAKRTILHLRANGINAYPGVVPLHYIEEVKRRFLRIAEYAAAESIHEKVVALPTDLCVHPKKTIEKMIEVLEDGTSSSTEDDSQGSAPRASEEQQQAE
jgi:hypothetical protein